MCGIIGIIKSPKSKLSSKEITSTFSDALYAGALRGMDGTGIAIFEDKKSSPVIYKRGLTSADFLSLYTTAKLFPITNALAVIGHNRAATIGTANDNTAHPFCIDNITLVHNGTLTNHRSLINNYNVSQGLVVDSEFLCNAIAKTKNPIEVLEKIIGSFALIWHNAETGNFYFAKNSQRPLGYVTNDDGDMFISSESLMMYWITKRNDIKIGDSIYEFESNYLYELNPDNMELIKTPFTPKSAYHNPHVSDWSKQNKENNGGKVNNNKKDRKDLKKKLKEFGLYYEKRVAFYPTEFDPYPANPSRGVVQGWIEYLLDGKYSLESYKVYDAVMYGVAREEAIKWIKEATVDGNYIEVPIISIKLSNNNDPIFICNAIKAVPLKEPPWSKVEDSFRPKKEKENGAALLPAPKKTSTISLPKKDENNTKDYIPGPGGLYIPVNEFVEVTKGGCSNCGEWINPNKADGIIWTGHFKDEPICPDCADLPVVKEHLNLRK